MILAKARVQFFKSIRDSGWFSIDPGVTCFVGKNESGKTAILQALAKLNPFAGDASFRQLDYPRNLPGGPGDDVTVVTSHWDLEDSDVEAVNEVLGTGVLTPQTISVEVGYYKGRRWSVKVDEVAALRHLLDRHPVNTSDELLATESVEKAAERLHGKSERTPADDALIAAIQSQYPAGTCVGTVINILADRIPQFVYIPEYFRMPGQISVEDLTKKKGAGQLSEGQKVFLAFLELAGLGLDDLLKATEYESLVAKLEWASNAMTRQIFEYWSQNRHLAVSVAFDQARPGDPPPFNTGYVVRSRIKNQRHQVSVGFDERSAGFVWFFSFLVWFSQARQHYGENLVILLDEPGLSLHAKAQADFLRYIEEKLAPSYQVLYTTHSPFLVDTRNLQRVRTVEDVWPDDGGEGEGTKVGDQVLSVDRDTVFPLQAALGYEITQTLFIGPFSLLVEGPSEILYIQWFSRRLGADGLDPRWTVCPTGGIDKIASFLSLFSGNDLAVAVLTDYAHGQKRKVHDLRASRLLEDGRVLTCDTFAEQPEADIEDVLGRELYVALVNDAYSLDGKHALPASRPKGVPDRVVKEVEEHFATLPPTFPGFDHYFPASHLLLKPSDTALPGLDVATERFRKMFQSLNSYLPAIR